MKVQAHRGNNEKFNNSGEFSGRENETQDPMFYS